MSEKSRFRRPYNNEHGKRAQPLLKSSSQHLDQINRSLPRKLSWKKSLFLACTILGLLVITLAANEKYPVLNRDNLTTPIQMQLSQKQKKLSECFAALWKSRLDFKRFEKKYDP